MYVNRYGHAGQVCIREECLEQCSPEHKRFRKENGVSQEWACRECIRKDLRGKKETRKVVAGNPTKEMVGYKKELVNDIIKRVRSGGKRVGKKLVHLALRKYW